MRNVTRVKEPRSFREKSRKWTRDLLNEIRSNGKASNYYYSRYNQKSNRNIRKDLEDRLLKMYSEMCCYCEGKTPRAQGEIEHLRPKRKFQALTYSWNNLHWSCSTCNGYKGELYDKVNPIVDPSAAESVSNHIQIKTDEISKLIWFSEITLRGRTTIEHTRLDRDDLKSARFEVFWNTIALIGHIRTSMVDAQTKEIARDKLKRLYCGEHGFVTTVRTAFVTAALRYDEL